MLYEKNITFVELCNRDKGTMYKSDQLVSLIQSNRLCLRELEYIKIKKNDTATMLTLAQVPLPP